MRGPSLLHQEVPSYRLADRRPAGLVASAYGERGSGCPCLPRSTIGHHGPTRREDRRTVEKTGLEVADRATLPPLMALPPPGLPSAVGRGEGRL